MKSAAAFTVVYCRAGGRWTYPPPLSALFSLQQQNKPFLLACRFVSIRKGQMAPRTVWFMCGPLAWVSIADWFVSGCWRVLAAEAVGRDAWPQIGQAFFNIMTDEQRSAVLHCTSLRFHSPGHFRFRWRLWAVEGVWRVQLQRGGAGEEGMGL